MTEVLMDSDVLVIGGGLAGCWAAIKAKALAPKVVLVDKALVSRSGASGWAYFFQAMAPQDDPAIWKQEMVEAGTYLNDQEWVDILLRERNHRLEDMVAWGIPFETDQSGNFIRKAGRGHQQRRFLTGDARTRMEILKKRARSLGVNVVERVMVTALLTSDGQHPTAGSVIGAVGFHTRTGDFVVMRSKAVIIASGPINFGTNLSGDGQAAAFRCGAELMSMEFCTPPVPYLTDGKRDLETFNVLFQNPEARLLNSRGERFMQKYSPALMERSDWPLLCQALAQENLEGRGPVVLDMSQAKPEYFDSLAKSHPGRIAAFTEAGIDLRRDRVLFVAVSRLSSLQGNGGIRIDRDGKTNVTGLFAAGSACHNLAQGASTGGGGGNLPFCCVSGYRAGEAAAKMALGSQAKAVNTHQLASLRKQIYAPLERKGGSLPEQLIKKIGDIIAPARASIIKSESRIRKTIQDLESVELSRGSARDVHELVKANAARNYALLAKLTFLSALERQESRYCHYREEYPYQDDKDWLKWILVSQKGEQGASIRTEDVPFERYPIQPPKRERIPHPVQFQPKRRKLNVDKEMSSCLK